MEKQKMFQTTNQHVFAPHSTFWTIEWADDAPMFEPSKKGRISELHPPPQVEMTQINLGECQQVLNWEYITNSILLTLNTFRNYG
jgi:hypothetical protein